MRYAATWKCAIFVHRPVEQAQKEKKIKLETDIVASGDATLKFPDVTPANVRRFWRLSEKNAGPNFGTCSNRNFLKKSCRVSSYPCLFLCLLVCFRMSISICFINSDFLCVSLCIFVCPNLFLFGVCASLSQVVYLYLCLYLPLCPCLSFVSISLSFCVSLSISMCPYLSIWQCLS